MPYVQDRQSSSPEANGSLVESERCHLQACELLELNIYIVVSY